MTEVTLILERCFQRGLPETVRKRHDPASFIYRRMSLTQSFHWRKERIKKRDD
jgi:hypothetical protein